MTDSPKWTDIAIVILTGGIMFFALMQWLEMRGAGHQTDQLVDYAKTQAKASRDIAAAAGTFSATAEKSVNEFKKAALESNNIAHEAVENTRTTIRNAQSAFRDDQRAWVAAGNVVLSGVQADAIPEIKIDWANPGKTFAKQVIPTIHFRLSGTLMSTERELLEAAKFGVTPQKDIFGIGAIGPQNRSSSSVAYDHKLSAPEISDIERSYTYFWGELTYYDVFQRQHRTMFCFLRYGTSGDFFQCPFHNDAD
jgi:hypothetical protein